MIIINNSMFNIKPSDISYPLYKYWIFYRFHVINTIAHNKLLFKQKFKVFVMILLFMFNLIRYAFYLCISKPNKRLPLHYFDFVQYFGGIKQLFYIVTIFVHNMILFLLIILNFSNKSDYKWFDIISAINGYKTFKSIDLCDKCFTNKYVHKIIILNTIF